MERNKQKNEKPLTRLINNQSDSAERNCCVCATTKRGRPLMYAHEHIHSLQPGPLRVDPWQNFCSTTRAQWGPLVEKKQTLLIFFFFFSFYFGVCFCAAPAIMSCSGQGHKKNEMSKCFYFQWIGFLPFSLIFVAACQFFLKNRRNLGIHLKNRENLELNWKEFLGIFRHF